MSDTWHHVINGLLVYWIIGSFGWCVLSGLGIVHRSLEARPNASFRAFVWATIAMIASWPIFLGVWLWRMAKPYVVS